MGDPEALPAKVDELLRQALKACDFDERARLIRKAAYWNEVAQKAAGAARPRPRPGLAQRTPSALAGG